MANEKKENETLVNYDTHANVKNEAMLILKQANQNGVKLGATVVDKNIAEGKPVLDMDKNPVHDNNGEVRRYADKYYVTLEFNGGTLKTEISKENYNSLEIGGRYSCSGRIGMVKIFKDELLLPIFNSFTYLYGNEDF